MLLKQSKVEEMCVGKKRIDLKVLHEALKALPNGHRRTFRHAAKVSGISVTAQWNALRRGDVKRKCSVLRPCLTEVNKSGDCAMSKLGL